MDFFRRGSPRVDTPPNMRLGDYDENVYYSKLTNDDYDENDFYSMSKFAAKMRYPLSDDWTSAISEINLKGVYLNPRKTKIFADALKVMHFKEKHTLHFLTLNKTEPDMQELVDGLQYCKNLSWIDLKDNNIGNYSATLLAKILPNFCTLEFLNLEKNSITESGMIALSCVLQECKMLKTLIIGGNNMTAGGILALAAVLLQCKALTTFIFKNNDSENHHTASLLFPALPFCVSLTRLSLNDNKLGAVGIYALTNVLPRLSLQVLKLPGNLIGGAEMCILAEALKNCKQLKLLDLNFNHIGDIGAIALAKIVPNLKHLERLLLAENNIGNEGGIALKCVIDLPFIKKMDLNNNLIYESVRRELKRRANGRGGLDDFQQELDLSFDGNPPISFDDDIIRSTASMAA